MSSITMWRWSIIQYYSSSGCWARSHGSGFIHTHANLCSLEKLVIAMPRLDLLLQAGLVIGLIIAAYIQSGIFGLHSKLFPAKFFHLAGYIAFVFIPKKFIIYHVRPINFTFPIWFFFSLFQMICPFIFMVLKKVNNQGQLDAIDIDFSHLFGS